MDSLSDCYRDSRTVSHTLSIPPTAMVTMPITAHWRGMWPYISQPASSANGIWLYYRNGVIVAGVRIHTP